MTDSIKKAGARGGYSGIGKLLMTFWQQVMGENMGSGVYDIALEAGRKYTPEVIAQAFVKTAKYRGGKVDKAKYLDTILREKAEAARSKN